jgi:outer membrane receptor protein involved in Fe transport
MNLVRCCIALMLACTVLAWAGTTGKISGRVVDHDKGEALPGANVVVLGAGTGAATDPDGAYVIMNLQPGIYQVRVTLVGYAPVNVNQVRVTADQTTVIDVSLTNSAVQLEDVIVQAERPMVQKDLTATSYTMTSEQIRMLPVKDFVEVVGMQAGVVANGQTLYVRGGRGNEVAFLIDGMYANDPVMGGLATRISNESIAELNFLSGTFNAEYGNALSGVVNVVTKEGAKSFSGNLEGRTSQFFVTPFKNYKENRVDATLSGPLLGDDLTFFATGERDARGSWLPYGYDNTLSSMAKLTAKIIAQVKANLTWRYSENEHRPYSHSWKYIPDQYLKIREKSRQLMASITHSVSSSLFYDIRASYFNQSYYAGVDKDTAEYIPTGAYQYLADKGTGFEFYSLNDPIEVTDNRTETVNVKADLVWQMAKQHEIKSGVEVKKHKLAYFDVYDPKRTFPYITDFEKHPIELAAYLQDKIELNSMVMNIGLRFDYADQLSPFRSNPLDANSIVASKPKVQWSPRVGVAHPISDRTSLHFSYGHFFQNPDYTRLYENSQYDINVREPIFGQPNLDAERTTAYEVGISHQFTDALAGSFTAFYKDVLGLVGTRYFPPFVEGRYVGYTLYMNEAYANIKGFEMKFELRRSRNFAGAMTYTYQVARGSASSETEDYPGSTQSTLLYPLSFDRPHLFNLNVNYHLPENGGPELLGGHPFANTICDLVIRANSGAPYTPTLNGRTISYIQKNSARMPATYSVDLEISKEWQIGPATFTAFLEILNLTDHKNVLWVYSDTGEPDVTYAPPIPSTEYMLDPSNFGPPRRMRLGARFRF